MKYTKEITEESAKWDLDPIIIACLIYQESKGDTAAFRYEPAFYRKYVDGKDRKTLIGHVPKYLPTLESEKISRACSWGLCQIMGQTAREQGFDGQYLTELSVFPSVNIAIGCKYLRKLMSFSDKKNDYTYGLLRYNGSGNPDYPSLVLKHRSSGNYLKVF